MTTQTTTDARTISAAIADWNLESIDDLCEMIDDLRAAIAEETRDAETGEIDAIDAHRLEIAHLPSADDLPSADIPGDIDTAYPVWACDKSGRCIVGEWSASEIEFRGWQIQTLEEIRAEQSA